MSTVVTTPEEVLKQHVSDVLAQVLPLLDTLHTLPFHNAWLESSPGVHYQSLLQQMEDLLLLCWEALKQQKAESLENLNQEVLQWWNSQQKRSPNSIQRHYYALHESLADWSQQALPCTLGLSGQWSDYIFFVLTQEKHLLARLCNDTSSQETQLLAAQYLKQMQQIADSAPHALCSDFFALLSVFTQESVFLPVLASSPNKSSSPSTTSSHQQLKHFYSGLKKSSPWKQHATEYCAILKQENTVEES